MSVYFKGQKVGENRTIIKEPEWRPDKDMQWAKKVCEDDTQTGFTYKVLQMINDYYPYTDIVVPSSGAVKTSDGDYYTSNDKHIWDDTNARQSEVGNYKTRWLIYYYNTQEPSITLLDNVMYASFDGVKVGTIFLSKKALQYFDIINGADLNSKIISMDNMFSGCSSLQSISLLNTSNVTSMNRMFYNCSSLQTIPLLNTSNVTNMNGMFYQCYSLHSIPLLDTSSVTDMTSMFQSCFLLQTLPLLDTSSVTSMTSMFQSCYSLQSIPLLNTSNVIDMSNMFYNCSSLQTIPLLNTSNVTSMSNMFYNCSSLQTIPLLNTSGVTSMRFMFYNCSSLQTIPLLNTSNVTSMSSMFNQCSLLQSIPELNLDSITSASNQDNLFSICLLLEFINLTNIKWNLSLTSSTKYSQATLESIIDNLVDLTGQTAQKLTVGKTNLAKISASKIAEAQAKNWSVA